MNTWILGWKIYQIATYFSQVLDNKICQIDTLNKFNHLTI